MTVVDMKTAKARRIERALDMIPEQLADIIHDDFKRGEFKKPIGMLVLVIDEIDDDGNQELKTYRAGVNSSEEIGYMEAWKLQNLNRWGV